MDKSKTLLFAFVIGYLTDAGMTPKQISKLFAESNIKSGLEILDKGTK